MYYYDIDLLKKKKHLHLFFHRPLEFFDGKFNESRFYVLHPDFLRYIRNR